MSYLLTAPTATLVLSAESATSDAIRTGTIPAPVDEVYAVESVGAACETLSSHDDIGVIVVTDGLDVDLATACAELHAAREGVPIVAYVDVSDGAAIAEATQSGATTVVPQGDEEGLASAMGTAIDRYRQRRTEAAESSMFTTLLEEIGVSIYVKDTDARHLRLANVPGAPDPKNAIGKTDKELYGDPEGAEETWTADRIVLEDGESIRERIEHFEAEGSDVWTKTTKVPWRDEDGRIQGLVGLSLNVTDEMKKEQQIEQFQDRFEEFASHLSHDLKSPLQVASGHLELAREIGNEEAFDKTAKALDRMERMIDDMSALATEEPDLSFETFEERGEIQDITNPTRIGDVVEEIWDIVSTDEATLRNHFEPDALIVAEEASVRPPLENLLRNAVVHGGPDVTVDIGPLDDWSGYYVADDGPGIPAEDRDSVFTEGYTTHEEGSGTGLAIVAENVEQCGWTIDLIESDAGGARFEIGNCPTIYQPDIHGEPAEPLSLTTGVDVGEFEGEGHEAYDPETAAWTIEGGGRNIWREVNEFRFVQREVDGAVRIQGRVSDVADLSEYSKAGFLVRDSLAEDAAYGGVAVTPQHGTELLWRTTAGGDGVSQHFEDQPQQFPWYRVDRVGDVVTCYCSSDGEQWNYLGQRRIELADPVNVGLAVCSFVAGNTTEATFEDVSVSRLALD